MTKIRSSLPSIMRHEEHMKTEKPSYKMTPAASSIYNYLVSKKAKTKGGLYMTINLYRRDVDEIDPPIYRSAIIELVNMKLIAPTKTKYTYTFPTTNPKIPPKCKEEPDFWPKKATK